MPSLHNKKFRTIFIAAISVAGIFLLFIESAQMSIMLSGSDNSSRKITGIEMILNQMNNELSRTRQIISAEPKQIIFIDDNNHINRYSYEYNTLWRNGDPIATDISSFNFEYRNRVGALIITADRFLRDVKTVAWVVRFSDGSDDQLKDSRVILASLQ
ncbi:hypothetical protein J7K93_10030 [bacterium]|nr:hypothetical protein [bacterium]